MKTIAAPAAEPITMAEARLHLRLDPVDGPHPDDLLVAAQISAAREWAEQYTGRFITPRTVEVVATAPAYPAAFDLPGASRVLSLSYVDQSGETIVIGPPAIVLDDLGLTVADGVAWPAGRAVRIAYIAGEECPAAIRAALLLITGTLYENRAGESDTRTQSMVFGVEKLLQPYRVNLGV